MFTLIPEDVEAAGALKNDGAPSWFSCTPGIGLDIPFCRFASLTSFLRPSSLSSLKLFDSNSVVLLPSVSVPAKISSSLVLVRVLSKICVASEEILEVAAP